jgi:hypothetical protein
MSSIFKLEGPRHGPRQVYRVRSIYPTQFISRAIDHYRAVDSLPVPPCAVEKLEIVLNLVQYSWLQGKKVSIKINYLYVLTGQLAPKPHADSKTGLKKIHKI